MDEKVHRVHKTTREMKSHHSHPTRVHSEGKESTSYLEFFNDDAELKHSACNLARQPGQKYF